MSVLTSDSAQLTSVGVQRARAYAPSGPVWVATQGLDVEFKKPVWVATQGLDVEFKKPVWVATQGLVWAAAQKKEALFSAPSFEIKNLTADYRKSVTASGTG